MSQFSYSSEQLNEVADRALGIAKRLGATASVVSVSEGYGVSVNVRNLQPETVELMRDKGLGVTVHLGLRRGNASTSDFSAGSVEATVKAALDIARYTAEDDCAGLPDRDRVANPEQRNRNLDLFHPWDLATDSAIELACTMESAALETDKAIGNSDGASVSTYQGQFAMANSDGFLGGYPYSRHSLSVAPIAKMKTKRGESMQREGWYSSQRAEHLLADPKALGLYAAQRALSRLGARKVPTCKVPVLFEAPLACGLLGSFVQAVSGGALYRKSSFLLDSLGKQVFSKHIDIYEDPFTIGAFGSSAFDDEGVATQARQVVDAGAVQGYFLGSYSARKLNMQTTGNAGGAHNLRLSSRKTKLGDNLAEMLKKLDTGLFLTDVMGQGVNYVNGDYSRGASGYWVEKGIIQFPVEEITIAGNLKTMFKGIVAVGSDEIIRGTKTCGSVLINQMAVAGD
jgi:PmbA protein